MAEAVMKKAGLSQFEFSGGQGEFSGFEWVRKIRNPLESTTYG